MNTQKIIIPCNEPYCLETKSIKWKGEFMENWYCDKHKENGRDNRTE